MTYSHTDSFNHDTKKQKKVVPSIVPGIFNISHLTFNWNFIIMSVCSSAPNLPVPAQRVPLKEWSVNLLSKIMGQILWISTCNFDLLFVHQW
jgi:hypothetical protein